MTEITGKQVIAAVLIIIIGPFQKKPVVIGGNTVGIYLQVRVNQGPAGRRQMILGDGHVYGLGVVIDNPGKIPAAV